MPRQVARPHPWRSAALIFGGLLLLGIISALLIRFVFTPYEFIDNLPSDQGMLQDK
jgi:hypothetical protein